MNSPTTEQKNWLNSMNTGARSFQQGHFNDAANTFSEATRILPEQVESWINLGAALLEARRFDASATALQKALSINPKLMISHMMFGDAMRFLGLSPQSLESYRTAVSLQRTPMGLNKLACALRAKREVNEAEELLREAIQLDSNFTLAKVNLATLHIEMSQFEEAQAQLNALAKRTLPPAEREEVENSHTTLLEYFRLKEPLDVLGKENNPAPLEVALADSPLANGTVDEDALKPIQSYIKAANDHSAYSSPVITDLPKEWPFIEAMFMVPMVNTVREYLEIKIKKGEEEKATGALLESVNMEAAIQVARKTRRDLHDPIKAELHMRHWHALACREVPGFSPGHFKYTQNRTGTNSALKRVEPALTSSTFRYFISDIYTDLEPGLIRAAIVWMTVCNLHPFADGNGRVAMNWLNRELEWAGLMPALFSSELGLKGELGKAMKVVRTNDGDLSPVLTVISKAQNYAVAFCNQLANS